VTSPLETRLSRRSLLGIAAGGLGAILLRCNDEETTEPGPGATPGIDLPVTNLEAMIGQMLMLGFRGYEMTPDNDIYAELQSGRLGNVVLFDFDVPNGEAVRNIASPAQVADLCQSIARLTPVRPLIGTDQEGGLIARLKPAYGFPPTPSHQELGALDNLDATRDAASRIAAMLAGAGINMNLAPVVDVNVNPTNPIIGDIERSFSADPEEVARQALAYIDGHHAEGVLTDLKHFPGHGSSTADSHLGFVDVTDTWSEDELIPYRRIVSAGKADAVMTAHIFNAKLDPEYPATLSQRTITGILRDQLGFDGVIITDDMQMGAIRNFYDYETAVVQSVIAGADIVAVANNSIYDPQASRRAFDAILNAVRDGRLSEARIEASFQRIMAVKSRLS
jgi:beta-N-acetylhexosaminidase